jgi:hypothetical protein
MAVAAPFSAVGGSTVRQSVRESERLEPSDFRVCSRTGNVLQSEHQQSGTRGLLSWQDERALLQQYSTLVHRPCASPVNMLKDCDEQMSHLPV